MTDEKKPLLSFDRHFDTSINIGDVKLPIKIKRLAKTQLEALDEQWERLVTAPRGSEVLPENPTAEQLAHFVQAADTRLREWNKVVEVDRYTFFEAAITDNVTLEEGLIKDGANWVVDGAGLIQIFHGRKDVLRDLLAAVISENHLMGLMRKNSSSPRASGPGSERSSQARGGDRPEPIAPSVEDSGIAANVPATVESAGVDQEDQPASSGIPGEETKVH